MRADHEHAVPLWKDSELWSLREDVSVEMEPGDGPVRLRGRWGDFTVPQPSPLVREVLSRMCLGPISLKNAIVGRERRPRLTPDDGELGELSRLLDRLQPLIIRSLHLVPGQPLISVVPLTVRSRFRPAPLASDVPLRLSVYAEVRTNREMYYIESPLALHRVLLHGPEAMVVIALLASPVTPAALTAGAAPAGPVTMEAVEYLAAAGVVVQAQQDAEGVPVFAEDRDPALAGWSPVDMMFHTRSTLGRHDHNFGITYPTAETVPAEPVVAPQMAHYIDLRRPSWDSLYQGDPPLTVAIEGRRSMRRKAAPVTITDLGELLYRTARVRSLISLRRPGYGDGIRYELSDRPYPSGGACYELEFYITVGDCEGLSPGVYHYDPLGHRLEPVSADRAAVDELLGCARVASAMDGQPPVLISMNARFRRLSWKYEGLAYRMVLMHVGVMVQNLYLVCTAMRLFPCAIGSVSIEAAARAFGTDWRTEPCVGQFIVGGNPGGEPEPDRATSQWRNVNDAQWAELARACLK